MKRTVYFDAAGKPRLVPSYCVFADFLGFRHEIKEAIRQGNEDTAFQRFVEEIEPEIEKTINPGSKDEIEGFPRMWDAKVFTDNIVLGYAIWSDRGESEFGHAITQLLEFQYAVSLKGFFVRGGWAVGNLFMNRNTVFGGSLLEAYDLETEVAVYPRIVLSDWMKDLVFRHMARYADDPPQCYHLLVDEKGLLFTNYLTEAIVDGDVQWKSLLHHAELVTDRLRQFGGDKRVFPKYQWLAAYHNFFCGLVSGCDGYSDAVRIPGDFSDFGLRQLLHEESPYVAEVQAKRRKWEEKMAKLKRSNGD